MKLRIINVKRFFKSTLIMLGLILAVLLFIGNTTLSHTDVKYESIYVSSGDTLWSIAKNEQTNNKYYDWKDIRDIIDNIKKVNGLSSSSLSVGQKLNIPTI